MQGIIVAAGIGSRLHPYSESKPKCLLEINSKPILFYIVENFVKSHVLDIVIVVGFCKDQIVNFLLQAFPSVTFHFVENKDYSTTNNAYSLLLSRQLIREEFVLSDSDIMFTQPILEKLINHPHYPSVAISRNEWDSESIKVSLTPQSTIGEISKEVANNETYFGESIGLEVFSYEDGQKLFDILEKRILNEKRINEFYEASFQEMICNGYQYYPVDIQNELAMEIDNEEDYIKAKKIFQAQQ